MRHAWETSKQGTKQLSFHFRVPNSDFELFFSGFLPFRVLPSFEQEDGGKKVTDHLLFCADFSHLGLKQKLVERNQLYASPFLVLCCFHSVLRHYLGTAC